MVHAEGTVGMAQDLHLPLDVMAAAPVCGNWQGQPLKRCAVIFTHRSLKLLAEHIVLDAPVPAGVESPVAILSVSLITSRNTGENRIDHVLYDRTVYVLFTFFYSLR